MVEHRRKRTMKAAFDTVKRTWQYLSDIRSKLPRATSFYPISKIFSEELMARGLDLRPSGNLL